MIRPAIRPPLRSEDGSATIEFVVMFPLVMFVFFTSFEAGYAMVRSALLGRALDQSLHDLQLGTLNPATADAVRLDLCTRLAVVACDSEMVVEMTVLNADRSNPPPLGSPCQNQEVTIRTATRADWVGASSPSELVVVRACQRANALFPTAVAGLTPAFADAEGHYRLVATGVFLNVAK